ncbi:hypothetical protein [Ideonella oryzae]|uniref:Uncharacterized protein n=1 Tax=Ideonella oryzae TaxID=2937441 RepID=A0ABT1BJR5_9BURK|nr:hypothetical protein [Ideonella oryzae]MCO5976348.1 hypothetical protein [Ideonella oryzae]
MNPLEEAPLAPPGESTSAASARTPADERLAHLFRHSLREGRLHPLYPLLRRYRQEDRLP